MLQLCIALLLLTPSKADKIPAPDFLGKLHPDFICLPSGRAILERVSNYVPYHTQRLRLDMSDVNAYVDGISSDLEKVGRNVISEIGQANAITYDDSNITYGSQDSDLQAARYRAVKIDNYSTAREKCFDLTPRHELATISGYVDDVKALVEIMKQLGVEKQPILDIF